MQRRYLTYAAAIASVLVLTYCSNGDVNTIPDPTVTLPTAATMQVPGITSSVTYSFDLGAVDPATNTYYVTDRTNKSIDVVNLTTLKVTGQFKQAFAGCNSTTGTTTATPIALPGCNTLQGTWTVNNDASGPDGLDVVGNTLFVGDVNKLMVLNKTTGALIATIAIASTPTGLRADEGCFDPVNNLYAISTPGDDNPFMTILDTTATEATGAAPTVKARLIMDNPAGTASGGLEACVFDTGVGGTGKLFVNNDGNNAVPGSTASRGEMDGIPVTSLTPLTGGGNVQYTTLAGVSQYALPDVVGVTGQCDPTGIALGPGTEIGAMCRTGTIGRSLNFLVLNKTTGAVAATVVGAGGGDQITYDAPSKRWFLANSRHTANGSSCGAGTATCPLFPALTVVADDGIAAPTLVHHITNGNNAHSVAVHPGLGLVVTPFSAPTANGGGAAFANGG